MQHLYNDLRGFGIDVQRHIGAAAEGDGATTLFFGPSTVTTGVHIAGDIDAGNDNRTDIAFVGDENWGTAGRTALALADVALHEAGHTYGLYHVQSGMAAETMGLRYNMPQNNWVTDTSFLDRSFTILPGHGPSGTQNGYQVMVSAFGLAPTGVQPVANALPSIGLPASTMATARANNASLCNIASDRRYDLSFADAGVSSLDDVLAILAEHHAHSA